MDNPNPKEILAGILQREIDVALPWMAVAEDIEAALHAAGIIMVPAEPTEAMVSAMKHVEISVAISETGLMRPPNRHEMIRAALAAGSLGGGG